MARGARASDYFPLPGTFGAPGPRVNPFHGGIGRPGIASKEFREGLTKNGLLVHLYGDGTRVVLNKSPGIGHWLFHAALDRVSGGDPHVKAAIMDQLAPIGPQVHGGTQILPGAQHVAQSF